MMNKSANMLALYILTLSAPALAQVIPAVPGPAPGFENRIGIPAFDCSSSEFQPSADNMKARLVHSPLMGTLPQYPNLGRFDLCNEFVKAGHAACLLFKLPSGEQALVRSMGVFEQPTDEEGHALENISREQVHRLGVITVNILTRCHMAQNNAEAARLRH